MVFDSGIGGLHLCKHPAGWILSLHPIAWTRIRGVIRRVVLDKGMVVIYKMDKV